MQYTRFTNAAIQLIKMDDDSYIVGWSDAIGDFPELVVGCIGPWVNTDDQGWASQLYRAMLSIKKPDMADVTACEQWRQRLFKVALHH
jgi:hypothetical protein